jgi:hypothetical protein
MYLISSWVVLVLDYVTSLKGIGVGCHVMSLDLSRVRGILAGRLLVHGCEGK